MESGEFDPSTVEADEAKVFGVIESATATVGLGYVTETELGAFTADYPMGELEGRIAFEQFARIADYWRTEQLQSVLSEGYVPNDHDSEVGFFDWFSQEWLLKLENEEVAQRLNLNSVMAALESGWRVRNVPGMCEDSIRIFAGFIAARGAALRAAKLDAQ
jgi:hypothetical protein